MEWGRVIWWSCRPLWGDGGEVKELEEVARWSVVGGWGGGGVLEALVCGADGEGGLGGCGGLIFAIKIGCRAVQEFSV